MKLLKNRKIAIIITIIVVILATMIGVGRSLNDLSREVELLFYEDADLEEAGFLQPSINRHLDVISQAILDASSLFAGHPELTGETQALTEARRDLMAAQSIAEKYSAYRDITKASEIFINSAGKIDLSDRETDALNDFQAKLRGATIAIQNNEYNNRAKNFMEGSFFIVYVLKPFVFANSPQLFG